ncbi:MAG: hypothetical protein GX784_05730 [Firmicutes bacterium]|nr:hypothetical protein [Candidatus Fermentithermobacillaceae bacterium]
MRTTVHDKPYQHNVPFRPFTELTWQLVASMLYKGEATPEEIASLLNRDVDDLMRRVQEAYDSGHLQKVIRSLPDDVPEQNYREFAARMLADTYKGAIRTNKKRKQTVKACAAAVKTAKEKKNFIDSDWAEVLCATANIDYQAYREKIEGQLSKFWQHADCPLARKAPQWLEADARSQE